jgi:hypothetical protein
VYHSLASSRKYPFPFNRELNAPPRTAPSERVTVKVSGTTTGPGASGTASIEAATWIKGVGVIVIADEGVDTGVGGRVIVIVVVIVGEDEGLGVGGIRVAVGVGVLADTPSNFSAVWARPFS